MGIVSRIQRFCLHDGSGVRSTVFFQGCPMRCKWCSNPETQSKTPVILYHTTVCIGCLKCVKACPGGNIRLDDQKLIIDRDRCIACGLCAASCPPKAISLSGREMSATEVFDIVIRDYNYYETSGGGITFSGGEATMQPEFLMEMMVLLKETGIDIVLETSGYCNEEIFARIARLCNAILFDVKHTNPEQHKNGTGIDNRQILRNLETAAGTCYTVIRVPLINNYNNDDIHIQSIAVLANKLSISRIELLPFHRLGTSKYESLGLVYDYRHTPPMCNKVTQQAADHLKQFSKSEIIIVGSSKNYQ